MTAVARRLVVVLLATGVVVAACLTGDRGAARAAVGEATGPLISSSLANTAILSARGLRPGDAKAGEITVQNVGDQAGAFALSSGGVVDGGVALSGALDLAVQDITPGRGSPIVYSGKLAALPSIGLGTLAEGELRRYRFTIGLPGTSATPTRARRPRRASSGRPLPSALRPPRRRRRSPLRRPGRPSRPPPSLSRARRSPPAPARRARGGPSPSPWPAAPRATRSSAAPRPTVARRSASARCAGR
jgi:hypothetical protein